MPNQTYKFKATLNTSNNQQPLSNEVLAQTLDTTSHNFTWQTFEFGQHSSSTLYDVAIINENDIWAVGEIYMNDSFGNPDPSSYNAVHWNGQIWELIKIGGSGGYPRRTVFAFSENDVWFDGVIKWDGVSYTVHKNGWPLMPNGDGWRVNKMWGSSNSDLYAVGNNGNIARYNGSSWTKIESGTTIDLKDISSDNGDIWVSGYSIDFSKSIILKLNNFNASLVWEKLGLNTPPYGGTVQSVWNTDDILFVSSTDGIFRKNTKLNLTPQKLSSNSTWKSIITGSNQNDIYTAGDYSIVMHYNGISWKKIHQIYSSTSALYSATVKENTFIGVGTNVQDLIFHKALLIIGKRL